MKLYKRNKPSKKRIIVPKNYIIHFDKIMADVGGDAREEILFDYEELKKVMRDAIE